MTAAQARHAILAVFFFGTLFELIAPLIALATINILFSFFVFLWYCRDRDATGRRRSLGRNIGIITLPFLTIPWYLMRRQPLRGKLRACCASWALSE